MLTCPHCDHPIRYCDSLMRHTGGTVWHSACWDDMMCERLNSIPVMRIEDWELEARRHETAHIDAKAAYDYHVSGGR